MRRLGFALTLFGLVISLQAVRADAEKPKMTTSLEQRFSKGLNGDIQKALEPLHKSRVLDDPVERELIEALFGVDRLRLWPAGNQDRLTVSVTLIKPGNPLRTVRSFRFANATNSFNFSYRCLSTSIEDATAIITFTGINEKQLKTVERAIYFDQKQKQWSKLAD
jgi:hypothetical protein